MTVVALVHFIYLANDSFKFARQHVSVPTVSTLSWTESSASFPAALSSSSDSHADGPEWFIMLTLQYSAVTIVVCLTFSLSSDPPSSSACLNSFHHGASSCELSHWLHGRQNVITVVSFSVVTLKLSCSELNHGQISWPSVLEILWDDVGAKSLHCFTNCCSGECWVISNVLTVMTLCRLNEKVSVSCVGTEHLCLYLIMI